MFDHEHGISWEGLPLEQRQQKLQFAIIALTEELGEIAGPVKKMLRRTRGQLTQEDWELMRSQVREEVVDVFAYLLKLSMLLEMDLKAEFLAKSEKNRDREAFKALRDRRMP